MQSDLVTTVKKKILIVCAGNTCRSPMAQVVLGRMLKAKEMSDEFEVNSAAYSEPSGSSAHPNAKQAIKEEYGSDLLAGHAPKKLTEQMTAEADLILVMKNGMKTGMPENKVIVLGIEDPYGSTLEGYKG